MEQETIIRIENAIPRFEHLRFDQPIDWAIKRGEHWAILGANGAGKTLLTDILTGKHALKEGIIQCQDDEGHSLPISRAVKSVAFRDIYGLVDTQNSYYQQRWNKGVEFDVPIIRDLVAQADQEWLRTLVEWFGISDLMEKEINLLSSGELRKFLIIRSLLTHPQIIILDNPFIGLDAASRVSLNEVLQRLSELEGLQVILVLSNPNDIPSMITRILPIKNKRLYAPIVCSDTLNKKSLFNDLFEDERIIDINSLKTEYKNGKLEFSNAAILKDIQIRYGQRTILKNLNWTIRKGEKWALLGPNGAGKSTLLSLICGDNPQAYANDITLFDQKRGTGESIWDIKKRIGFISPEMHLYYLKNVRCLDVVGSGFFDTIGLYKKCNTEQEIIAKKWMEIFGISHIKDISFLNISSGEQRLVLLARVLVKNPDLLILDEPLHGLDVINKQRVKKIIEQFCDADKSLIYVTHYEDEIPSVVDNRLVLTKNK